MNTIKNILALVGLIAVVVAVFAAARAIDVYTDVRDLDPQAIDVYRDIGARLIETGSAAEATVWKVPVKKGLTVEEVELTMKNVAIEHNIRDVGELPLYKQVEAMTGKPYRFAKIYMFCNALTAAKMIDYNDAFSAYLPCRVTLIEDKQGQLWLYTINMDVMIHGGRPLPPELKQEAMKVKETLLAIMKRGGSGEF